MICEICGEEMYWDTHEEQTCVGYYSPPGHDHDDNCRKRKYVCKNGHIKIVSKRNRCPNPDCDWVGQETCFCHPGKKVDEWPE